MSFKSKFVHNRTINRKFHRRAYATQQTSKIDRRREKLNDFWSLHGKVFVKILA